MNPADLFLHHSIPKSQPRNTIEYNQYLRLVTGFPFKYYILVRAPPAELRMQLNNIRKSTGSLTAMDSESNKRSEANANA